MAQKAIDEDERCELVQVLLGGEMARYFSHQWRTPDKTVDAAAAPIAMTPPTIP